MNGGVRLNIRLKPIHEQVIVITGGSSGIGLVTARLAAKRGARVVVTSRNEEALHQLTKEIVGAERTSARMVMR
jgi:short-subunit dehydrogenase